MSFAETEEMASSVALLIQNLTTCLAGLDLHQAVLKRYEEDKKKGVRSPYPQLKLGESFITKHPDHRASLLNQNFTIS